MLEKFLYILIPSICSYVAVSFGQIRFLNYRVLGFAVLSEKETINCHITDEKSPDSSPGRFGYG